MCIICFLKESFQYSLRNSSQMRSDRFEHTLYRYKNSFIAEFKENLGIEKNICNNHDNDKNKRIIEILKNIEVTDIDYFFSELIKIYVSWIDAELSNSLNAFEELLEKYNILNEDEKIYNLILFRGRKSKNIISHWDMFHIPFNKRFHIGNQRYSLVGQPLLYLANSPYCVYRELETSEELRISSFRFKEKCNIKIFNNSNLFFRYIKENNSTSSMAAIDEMIEDVMDDFNMEEIKRIFFLLILESCCSFQRRSELKNTSFCEEYVLPQILAQVLKCKKFHGIMYTSTKAYYDKLINNNDSILNMIYKNICIFTNYNKENTNDVTYVYDKDLYNKFIISAPLNFEMQIDSIYYDFEKSLRLIKYIQDNCNEYNEFEVAVINSINDILISYNDEYTSQKQKNKNDNLEQNKFYGAIDLHSLLLRNIILNVKEK